MAMVLSLTYSMLYSQVHAWLCAAVRTGSCNWPRIVFTGSGLHGRVAHISRRLPSFPYSGRNSEERYSVVDVRPIVGHLFVSLAYFFELLGRLTRDLRRRVVAYSLRPLIFRGETI